MWKHLNPQILFFVFEFVMDKQQTLLWDSVILVSVLTSTLAGAMLTTIFMIRSSAYLSFSQLSALFYTSTTELYHSTGTYALTFETNLQEISGLVCVL